MDDFSFNSSTDIAKLFAAMFPNSEIAKQFSCGERKAAYMTVFACLNTLRSYLIRRVWRAINFFCGIINFW